ncbi:MAG: hypothetical protein INR66_18725 [Gordonia polyisoprenivorans]|nr:hypothetical protein [Gordonia polyisoprenivorans]
MPTHRTPRKWAVVDTAEQYQARLAAGDRRIDVRRLLTENPEPQAELIDLGSIPVGVEVRVSGIAAARVTGGSVLVTDAGHVEAIGDTTVHAYGTATVIAFDTTAITGNNHTRITICDHARAVGYDHTAIAAWDTTTTRAHHHTTVVTSAAGTDGEPTVHLTDHAWLYTDTRLHVTGPARDHITIADDPYSSAPIDLTY